MHVIASFCLNLSFFLYLLYYLPQLMKNAHSTGLRDFSLGFHCLAITAATADLCYAFLLIHQWQYRVVSIVYFSYLLFQHGQLYRVCSTKSERYLFHFSTVVIPLCLSCVEFIHYYPAYAWLIAAGLGWVERCASMLAKLPQLLKNRRLRSSRAISRLYLYLNLIVTLCDIVSAWYFHWGPSSRYGSPVALCFTLLLLYQSYSYQGPQRQRWGRTYA
jgi:uncharacterized protein with PQ loop repeat